MFEVAPIEFLAVFGRQLRIYVLYILFTTLALCSELKKRGYKGTGTIRYNRLPGNCPFITEIKLLKECF